jgi:SAM-dependent methyltransferase
VTHEFTYLLGDTSPEAARLAFQASLWDPLSHALFERAGVAKGWRVLELGPGAGSLHRELRRRVEGPIDAVEQSATFAASLPTDGRVWNAPLASVELPENHYDFIFARWVFLFLPDPLEHLQILVKALRPGGIIAIQDYFRRDTFTLVPQPENWDELIAADRAFFELEGADANVAARLPRLYEEAGVECIDVTPHIKSGNPGSAVWTWLTTYYVNILDRYAAIPPMNEAIAHRIRAAFEAAEQNPASLLVAPAVLDVVGRKRAGGADAQDD